MPNGEKQLVDTAMEVAPLLARWASVVDAENRFPQESVKALHDAGLLGLMASRSAGGAGATFRTLWDVAATLGGACPSTGMIFAMHCSQVAVLSAHGLE